MGLDAVPFRHPELGQWRANFTGIRWQDPETGWTLCGAVDDVWQAPTGELIVADYKATSRAEMPTTATLYGSYRRQIEVYQFLLRARGFPVSSRGWFVFTNGDGRAGEFGDKLCFTTALVPYDGDDAWVLEAFRRAVATVALSQAPPQKEGCDFCGYVAGALAAGQAWARELDAS